MSQEFMDGPIFKAVAKVVAAPEGKASSAALLVLEEAVEREIETRVWEAVKDVLGSITKQNEISEEFYRPRWAK